jgi:hypothetical protein
LAFASEPRRSQRNQRLTQRDGYRHGTSRFSYPHAIDEIKALQALRQRL